MGVVPQPLLRAVPSQAQPAPRFFQVVFAALGQAERASPQAQEPTREFQGRLPQEPASRVPQGVLPQEQMPFLASAPRAQPF